MDEELGDAIQTIVDDHYETYPGPATLTVQGIRSYLARGEGREVGWNEVAVACDALVEEGRLVFLRDHGKDGRSYCSTRVPDATVALLREDGV